MNKLTISLIAALSENRVIGRDNKLPWHIPEDLKRFKDITAGHPVIMGRKTYQSIGRLLPNRLNIIITRDVSFKIEGAKIVSSLEAAIEKASEAEILKQVQDDEMEIFIIGGGQIFEQAIDRADKLYLTIVHTTIEGDAFFPDYSAFTNVTFKKDSESNGYRYTFLDLER